MIKLFQLNCGSVRVKKRAAIDDGVGEVDLPIPAYLIMHPAGNVLFDTGPHADLIDPTSDRLGNLAKYMTLSFRQEDHILAQLQLIGLKHSDIKFVVNSHLHYDHAGGNSAFDDTTFVVQRTEWDAAHQPELIARNAYIASDYDMSNASRVLCIEGEHDLFGDGSIVLFPTFGHTPGHQSMRVAVGARVFVLVADVCYLKENLDRGMVSRLSFNIAQARTSLELIAALGRDGAEVLIGHDAAQSRALPHVPAPIAAAP
jgi:glyoxylase-like metal-dependent hydrolase (beta-lactamase superfamily II)